MVSLKIKRKATRTHRGVRGEKSRDRSIDEKEDPGTPVAHPDAAPVSWPPVGRGARHVTDPMSRIK
jgi:hypothetical protein